jgi:hypothetical protein
MPRLGRVLMGAFGISFLVGGFAVPDHRVNFSRPGRHDPAKQKSVEESQEEIDSLLRDFRRERDELS